MKSLAAIIVLLISIEFEIVFLQPLLPPPPPRSASSYGSQEANFAPLNNQQEEEQSLYGNDNSFVGQPNRGLESQGSSEERPFGMEKENQNGLNDGDLGGGMLLTNDFSKNANDEGMFGDSIPVNSENYGPPAEPSSSSDEEGPFGANQIPPFDFNDLSNGGQEDFRQKRQVKIGDDESSPTDSGEGEGMALQLSKNRRRKRQNGDEQCDSSSSSSSSSEELIQSEAPLGVNDGPAGNFRRKRQGEFVDSDDQDSDSAINDDNNDGSSSSCSSSVEEGDFGKSDNGPYGSFRESDNAYEMLQGLDFPNSLEDRLRRKRASQQPSTAGGRPQMMPPQTSPFGNLPTSYAFTGYGESSSYSSPYLPNNNPQQQQQSPPYSPQYGIPQQQQQQQQQQQPYPYYYRKK